MWAPTGVINIHYPELWAFLFFTREDKKAADFPITEDEYRKWELRKLYYAQQAYLDENGQYTDSLDTLREILARISPCEANRTVKDLSYQLATTPHSFEITCPGAEEGTSLSIFSDGRTSLYPS